MQYNKISVSKIALLKTHLIDIEKKANLALSYPINDKQFNLLNSISFSAFEMLEDLNGIDPEPIQLMADTHDVDDNGCWTPRTEQFKPGKFVLSCPECNSDNVTVRQDNIKSCLECGYTFKS